MSDELGDLFEESIQLELNLAELYMFYYSAFTEDDQFWWRLSVEEKNHAALLKSGREYLELGLLPEEVVSTNLEHLIETNRTIKQLLKSYAAERPSMEEAYRVALELEQSAGELHFQQLIAAEPQSKIVSIFQRLNGQDRDHVERIERVMVERGICAKWPTT